MVDEIIDSLISECEVELKNQGFPPEKIKTDIYLNLRYDRTDCALMCLAAKSSQKAMSKHGDFLATFRQRLVGHSWCYTLTSGFIFLTQVFADTKTNSVF